MITITRPAIPLVMSVQSMAIGNVLDASRTSSATHINQLHPLNPNHRPTPNLHICTAESGPINEFTELVIPTTNASPAVGHPALFCKPDQTSLLGAISAITQRVTRMAKKPVMCSTSIVASMRGSLRAKKVLKMQPMDAAAMARRVECQG